MSTNSTEYFHLKEEMALMKAAINTSWVLVSTAMIFLMQAGFALVECGSVRKKNSSNILIKNLFDACMGALGFWLIGYGLAFGDVKWSWGTNPAFFAANNFDDLSKDHYLGWIF